MPLLSAVFLRLGYIKLSDYDLAIGPGGRLISLRADDADDWQIGARGGLALSAPSSPLAQRGDGFQGAPENAWSSPPTPPRDPALPEPVAGSASPSGSPAAAPPRFEPPAAPAPSHTPTAAAAPFSAEPASGSSSPTPQAGAEIGDGADPSADPHADEDDEWQWQLALARARAAAEDSADDAAAGDDDQTSVAHKACREDPSADIDDEPTSSFQAAPPARQLPLRPATHTRQIAVAPAPIVATAATRRRLARGSGGYRATEEAPSRSAAARALAAARASATQTGRQAPLPRISHHRIRPPGIPDSGS